MKVELDINSESVDKIIITELLSYFVSCTNDNSIHPEDIKENKKIAKALRRVIKHYSSVDQFKALQEIHDAL